MAETIPIRALVLYKHGVGFVTRQGTVGGRELELSLRADEVDDVLKSLVTLTLDGGQVTGIHYQTPENKAERLADIPLAPGDRHALFDLLRDIRGVPVSLELEGGRATQGRVLGVERHPQGRKDGATVLLLTGDTTVEQIPSERIVRIALEDKQVAGDLRRFLDASQSEEARRTIRIALSEPGRQVQLSYAIPSPVWRVAYRLVGSEDGGERRALLQGWGIFDNRLDEDLEEVEVALVAGQPVSFRYDLTSSIIPERPFVRDQARVAAGPVEFEGGHAAAAPAQPPRGDEPMVDAPARLAFMKRAPMRPMAAMLRPAELESSTLLETAGRDLDELFEYRVGAVSARRGESAMVPVVQHTAGYRRELLYNGQKQPRHPVASLRLRNQTGLTLERGPITIVEDGQYRGEAILPFTKPEGEIVLAYAVELGIAVREESAEWTTTAGLDLHGAYLQVQEYFSRRTTYRLNNSTAQEQVVTIERPRADGAELAGTRAPDEETAEHRRWRVACSPRATTDFEVVERTLLHREVTVVGMSLAVLAEFLENRFLDTETRRALETILRLRQTIQDVDTRLEALRAEQVELGSRQDRLRQNLTIQAASEQEQEIRRRSAAEFQRTQDREEAILTEIDHLLAERKAATERLEAALAQLA